jgi:hypothetical protein
MGICDWFIACLQWPVERFEGIGRVVFSAYKVLVLSLAQKSGGIGSCNIQGSE